MDNRTHIGLDVHKATTAVAVLRPGSNEPDNRTISTTPEAYRKLVKALRKDDVVFCYEAGPCGFDPYRDVVVAWSPLRRDRCNARASSAWAQGKD